MLSCIHVMYVGLPNFDDEMMMTREKSEAKERDTIFTEQAPGIPEVVVFCEDVPRLGTKTKTNNN